MNRLFLFRLTLLVSIVVMELSLTSTAHAATLVVNTLADENDHSCTDGDCSLRDAVEVAGSGDMITFSVAGTITLVGGEVGIGKNLSISGPGAGSLAISGGGASRVFNISSGSVFISGLTVRDGRAERGGGIYNNGTLTLANIVVTANVAETTFGGGILNNGTLMITNGTISGNSSLYGGGGVYGGTTTILSSTISGNSTDGYGGGLANSGGAMLVSNSAMTGNSANSGGAVFATFSGSITITCSRIQGNATGDPNDYDVEVSLPGGILQVDGNWWGAATGPNTPGADTTNATVSSFSTSPNVSCGAAKDGPPDDRINWLHGDSHAIIYPRMDDKGKPDLHIYCMDVFGNGALELIVTQEMFDEAPRHPANDTKVAGTDECRIPVNVYVLTTGEYQVNIGPDIGGTTQEVIFTGLPPAHVYFGHFNLYYLFK